MTAWFAQRLLNAIPLLLGITLVCFLTIKLAPGDPISLMADLNPKMAANEAMKEAYGLNDPWYVQYGNWLNALAHGKLGTSLAPDGRAVADKIADALPITVWLNVIGLMLVIIISVPLALLAATRPDKLTDHVLTIITYIGAAAPGVWLAVLALQYFSVGLGWLPLAGIRSFGAENLPWYSQLADLAWHATLPLAVGVFGSLAGILRFMRGSLIETLRQDYLLTAQAKGASRARVLTRHALRNALLPLITILGLSLPGLIGGSVIMESLFALPGLGLLFYSAVLMRDYPVLMALLTAGAVLTLLGNLLADFCTMLADPRTRAD
ncbi:MAG TPA: ABC transporter permease [Alphaproteobacteria bacterium]|nr:ABC transporter permease [Alphaproteobacteria bacterium]